MLDEVLKYYIARRRCIKLTRAETDILAYLIDHKQRLVSVNEIQKYAFHGDVPRFLDRLNNIRVVIHRLKHKLQGEVAIITRKGIGYGIEYIGERLGNGETNDKDTTIMQVKKEQPRVCNKPKNTQANDCAE